MLKIAFSLILLLQFISFAQPTSQFDLESITKIHFILEKNRTKEMVLPQQSEVHEEIGNEVLDSKSQSKLLKIMNKASSYSSGQALLTHHNIIFNFYLDKTLNMGVHISTLTRNIHIYDTISKNEIHCRISNKFGKFIIRLLIRYGWYEEIVHSGDMDGIL